MKLHTIVLSALLSTSLFASNDAVKQEGVGYIQLLGSTLKSNLQMHMKADPSGVAALGFCTAKAMDITAEVNKKLPPYATVRRTALKTRNTLNTPDITDKEVMATYLKTGSKEVKVAKAEGETRVYKPLFLEKACLKCHGTNLDPTLKNMILENYPQDEAIGFKEGDFRGVIVVQIKAH
jgi:hypothetical protein